MLLKYLPTSVTLFFPPLYTIRWRIFIWTFTNTSQINTRKKNYSEELLEKVLKEARNQFSIPMFILLAFITVLQKKSMMIFPWNYLFWRNTSLIDLMISLLNGRILIKDNQQCDRFAIRYGFRFKVKKRLSDCCALLMPNFVTYKKNCPSPTITD